MSSRRRRRALCLSVRGDASRLVPFAAVFSVCAVVRLRYYHVLREGKERRLAESGYVSEVGLLRLRIRSGKSIRIS